MLLVVIRIVLLTTTGSSHGKLEVLRVFDHLLSAIRVVYIIDHDDLLLLSTVLLDFIHQLLGHHERCIMASQFFVIDWRQTGLLIAHWILIKLARG